MKQSKENQCPESASVVLCINAFLPFKRSPWPTFEDSGGLISVSILRSVIGASSNVYSFPNTYYRSVAIFDDVYRRFCNTNLIYGGSKRFRQSRKMNVEEYHEYGTKIYECTDHPRYSNITILLHFRFCTWTST